MSDLPNYFWLVTITHATMIVGVVVWETLDHINRMKRSLPDLWWKFPLVMFLFFPYNFWLFPKYVLNWELSWLDILF